MPDLSWSQRFRQFVHRVRYGKADPNSPEYKARLKAEAELDGTLRAQRDAHYQRGRDTLNGPYF